MRTDLRHQWIAITGCSTGIGEDAAKSLLDAGYSVVATLRNRNECPAWMLGFDEDRLLRLSLDLRNPPEIESFAEKLGPHLRRHGGQLRALVNNAGVCFAGPLEVLSAEALVAQMQINCFAPVALTRQSLGWLRESKGYVVNIGSAAGCLAFPFLGAYAMSKHAMEAWSDSLRRELSTQGIRVVLFQLGSINTPIWGKLYEQAVSDIERCDPQLRALYQPALLKFLATNEREAKKRKTRVQDVSQTILRVLAQSRPKARYRIGIDAYLADLCARLVPDAALDRYLEKQIFGSKS